MNTKQFKIIQKLSSFKLLNFMYFKSAAAKAFLAPFQNGLWAKM